MIAWLVEALFMSSVLMLFVLAVRRPVAHHFGPQAAYALWALPALRMILPPMPEGFVAASPLMPVPAMVKAESVRVFVAPVVEAGADWSGMLIAFWLSGAALSAAAFLIAYLHLARRVHADGYRAGERGGIPIIVSGAVQGPLAIGILRRAIVLPAHDDAGYSDAELDLAIRHEAEHHRGRDLAINFVALAVRAIHWFNPIAIVAHRAFRADQEMACDARVLAQQPALERFRYAHTLVKTAAGRPVLAASPLGSVSELKRRLKMIDRIGSRRGRAPLAVLLVGSLVGGGLAATASGSVAAERIATTAKAPLVALAAIAPPMDVPEPAAVEAVPPPPPIAALEDDHRSMREAHEAPRGAQAAAVEASRATVASARASAHAAVAQARADAHGHCSAEARGRIEVDMPDGPPMVICVPQIDERAIREKGLAGLRAARAAMARDEIKIDVRRTVLEALDEAIAEMEAEI